MISVIIPVFRYSAFLNDLIRELLKEKIKKEIIVVIDEPTEESLKIVSKFKRKVKFILNRKRKGKVNAINEVFPYAKGNILVFLDADITIGSKNFLKNVSREIKDVDILEIKSKVVGNSFFAMMEYYDNLAITAVSWLLSKRYGCSFNLCGASFAIKTKCLKQLGGFRRVVSEDVDLATRAFARGFKSKVSDRAWVYKHVDLNLKSWFAQRKRWLYGGSLWLKDSFLRGRAKLPGIVTPTLSALINFPGTFLFIFALLGAIFHHVLAFVIASMFIMYLIVKPIAVKLGYNTNIVTYAIFYFVYSPIVFAMLVFYLVKVLLFSGTVKLTDWKV